MATVGFPELLPRPGGNLVGIDPGLSGAIAVQGLNCVVTMTVPTLDGEKREEFDLAGMTRLLEAYQPIRLVVLEKVSGAPVRARTSGKPAQQSSQSMFRFGTGFGAWLGIMTALRIPYQLVTPQAWKKAVLAGTTKDKAAAITFAQSRYPAVSLLATPRSRVPHDGIADAICLMDYAAQLVSASVADVPAPTRVAPNRPRSRRDPSR